MNERITENIVREHIALSIQQGGFGGACFWEQKPDNKRIQKLLSTASKSGKGLGRPEFIVAFDEREDFLIVVECKADPARHESQERNNPVDYAVDGVLHYAKHLNREFNILAIAISGTDESTLRVGHFLQFKGENMAEDATQEFGVSLLPLADYLDGYRKHGKLFNQDLNDLLLFTKELNSELHSLKIKEAHRSLLISAILMALKDDGFASSYRKTAPPLLLKRIKDTMIHSMQMTGMPAETIGSIKTSYGFINAPGKLVEGRKLPDLIASIDDKINSFNKTHEYYDVLGQLYIEFLRYSNSDKGLGIVLTPPHITELAADLAAIGSDDILYDNCAGTGSFLIAGMKKMIRDAKGNSAKIRKIKEQGIVGVEMQADIVSLLCSNMFIHGDGKSNVIQGDCFTPGVKNEIKNDYSPTVGFLNPPFKGKATDTEEILFVLNNLDALVPKGRCVALLPMQWALVQTGKRLALKKKLFENHTLEAVISLPNEIFHNSKVGVVTCLMLFTAHQPHPPGKKTWFAYCKDDGFVKKKAQGRIDYRNQWDGIKKKWVEAYLNRENIPGFSVMKEVRADDEWCAEAYIETDYANFIESNRFILTIKDYVIFKISRKIQESNDSQVLKLKTVSNESCTLNMKNWRPFNLLDLFTITGSNTTSLDELKLHGAGKFPYITTQAVNNGTAGYYDYFTEDSGVLTVDSAVLGYTSYQSKNFSASDHVEKLIPQFPMNEYVALFLVAVLNEEQFRYNYGRKCSQQRLSKITIKLPAKGTTPDFQYMEGYIKSLPFSSAIAA